MGLFVTGMLVGLFVVVAMLAIVIFGGGRK